MTLPLRSRVAVAATRGVNTVSRRLGVGSGTVIGGRAGLAIDPGLLGRLAAGRQVALVSGTNGKTTTTRLLAVALEHGRGGAGVPASGGAGVGASRRARQHGGVVTNATGANMPAGHVAALAGGRPGAPAVLEVDEGYLPGLVRALRPAVVVLLNLSRDQLDRTSEVRMLAGRWREALAGTGETTVVANADDPLVAWGAGAAPRVVWVGAGLGWQLDAVGCPACEGRIDFGGGGAGAGASDGSAGGPERGAGRSRGNVDGAGADSAGPGGAPAAGAAGRDAGGVGAGAGRFRGDVPVVVGAGGGTGAAPDAAADGGWSCACGFARPTVDVRVVDRADLDDRAPRAGPGLAAAPAAGTGPAGSLPAPGTGQVAGAGTAICDDAAPGAGVVVRSSAVTMGSAAAEDAPAGGGTEAVWAGGRRAEVTLRIPGRFNRGNAVMAAAAAEALGVPAERALTAMVTVGEVGGRFTVRRIGGVPTRLLLAKNPAGWHELLGLVCPGRSPVVVGINARVADGRDPSWLWDVPFEMLQGRPVVATGERCLDLAVRLHYAGVPHRTVRDPRAAVALAGRAAAVPVGGEGNGDDAGGATVEFIGNYTAFHDLLEGR